MGLLEAPKIGWLHENPQLEGDRDNDLVPKEVPDQYADEVRGYLERLFNGGAGSSGVYDERFIRSAAEILMLMDWKREAQGKRSCIEDLRFVLVCEMYRCHSRYREKRRKSLQNTFFAHLIDSVRREIVLNGVTEPAALIAQVNHDVVEDNRDKAEIEFVKRQAEERAERTVYVLPDGEEVPPDRSWKSFRREIPIDGEVSPVRVVFVDDLRGMEVSQIVEDGGVSLRAAAEDYVKKHRDAIVAKAGQKEEDRQVESLSEGLMDFGRYRDHLKHLTDAELTMIRQDVRECVKGVTKAKQKDPKRTAEAALAHQLEISIQKPFVATVKAADRSSNTNSIGGHQDPDKEKDIMKDTYVSHVPTSRVFGLRRSEAVLAHDCVRYLNPALLEAFTTFAEARWTAEVGDEWRANFVRQLSENCNSGGDAVVARDHIVDVQFLARDLSYYLRRVGNKPLEEVTLEDLKIGELDPMMEVVVTTRPRQGDVDAALSAVAVGGTSSEAAIDQNVEDVVKRAMVFREKLILREIRSFIDKATNAAKLQSVGVRKLTDAILVADSVEHVEFDARGRGDKVVPIIEAAFAFKKKLLDDLNSRRDNRVEEYVQKLSRYKATGKVRSFVGRRLTSSFDGASLQADIPGVDTKDVYLGMKLRAQGHSADMPVRVRVNDSCFEAMADRGVLAEGTETPEDLRVMIRSSLDAILAFEAEGRRGSLYDVLNEELFGSTIQVKTKGGELMELPRGATGLDMAYKLHGDLLVGMVSIKEVDDPLAEHPEERAIARYQPLKHGKAYIIKVVSREEKSPLCPEDCLFSRGSAAAGVRRHLRSRGPAENIKDGRRYLEELSVILDCKMDDFLRIVGGKMEIVDCLSDNGRDEIYEAIGNAGVNPVRLFADVFEKKAEAWKADVVRQAGESPVVDADNDLNALYARAVEKGVGFWEIEVELPDEVGADIKLKVILRDNRLNVYEHRAHYKDSPRGGCDTLRYMLDLNQENVSIYDLFRSLVRVNRLYPVKVVADFEEHFELQKRILGLRRFDVSGGAKALKMVLAGFEQVGEVAAAKPRAKRKGGKKRPVGPK